MMVFFTIFGQTPAKKNTHQIRKKGSRTWIAPDDNYATWEKDAVSQLWVKKVEKDLTFLPLKGPIEAKFLVYRKTNQRVDLSNLIQSIEDALERADIIENDFQIESYDGSRRILGVPSGTERAEIFLKEFE
jgi:Holliday junction resolvase RusA-like endonuclease